MLQNLTIDEIDNKFKKLYPEGSSRTAYDIGNGKVIKIVNIQNKDKGNFQCKTEIEIYEKELQYKQYLCPIFEWYYDKDECIRLVMQKAEKLPENIPLNIYTYNEEIRKICDVLIVKHNLQRADLMNSFNWGIINNQYVLIDYGLTVSAQYQSALYKIKDQL